MSSLKMTSQVATSQQISFVQCVLYVPFSTQIRTLKKHEQVTAWALLFHFSSLGRILPEKTHVSAVKALPSVRNQIIYEERLVYQATPSYGGYESNKAEGRIGVARKKNKWRPTSKSWTTS